MTLYISNNEKEGVVFRFLRLKSDSLVMQKVLESVKDGGMVTTLRENGTITTLTNYKFFYLDKYEIPEYVHSLLSNNPDLTYELLKADYLGNKLKQI